MTAIIVKALQMVMPMRANLEQEVNGLDLSMHGERAYEFNS